MQQSGGTVPPAIILVAGLGRRLGGRTVDRPKCLVEVNGTPILVNALDRLLAAGVREAVIVVGYPGGRGPRADWRARRPDADFVSRERRLRNVEHHAVPSTIGVDGVDRDILILEGDVFFDQRLIDHFLALRIPDGTAVERWRPGLDGSVVTVSPDGRVNAWIHKKDRPAGFGSTAHSRPSTCTGSRRMFVRAWLRPALAAQVARDGGGEPIETVFADIVRNGGWVHAVEVRGSWIEIDDEIGSARRRGIVPGAVAWISIASAAGTAATGVTRTSTSITCSTSTFPPAELYAELQAAVLTLANSYPSSQRVLADLVARWKEQDGFTADNLVIGNGSSELIKLLNDRVMTKTTVPLPTFNEFIVRRPGSDPSLRARVRTIAFDSTSTGCSTRSGVQTATMRCRQSEQPGREISSPLDDIRQILDSGVTLVIDEAFMAFTDGRHSAEPLVSEYSNLVIVTSMTKSLGIAGLRVGYVLTSNDEVKRRLREALPIWNVNSLAEYVIEALPRYRAAASAFTRARRGGYAVVLRRAAAGAVSRPVPDACERRVLPGARRRTPARRDSARAPRVHGQGRHPAGGPQDRTTPTSGWACGTATTTGSCFRPCTPSAQTRSPGDHAQRSTSDAASPVPPCRLKTSCTDAICCSSRRVHPSRRIVANVSSIARIAARMPWFA